MDQELAFYEGQQEIKKIEKHVKRLKRYLSYRYEKDYDTLVITLEVTLEQLNKKLEF